MEAEKNSYVLTEELVLAKARSADLSSVQKINCWGSHLTDVSIFEKMPNIEMASLSVNSISTLRPFSKCQVLSQLYLRKNNISDINEIRYLTRLQSLKVLCLSDNPCSDDVSVVPSYRMTVLRHLPCLQNLDNLNVTEDEVSRAFEEGSEIEGDIDDDECKSTPLAPSSGSDENCVASDLSASGDHEDALTLTFRETNDIRERLGLKPLTADKLSPAKTVRQPHKKQCSNILAAVLALIRELDYESLKVVANATKGHLETF